jgi:hypothetical protein
MAHINDILPEFKITEEYKSRRFLNGDTRQNYRNQDPYPNHKLGTYTPHTPEDSEPVNITYEDFLNLFRQNFMRYAKKKNWPITTSNGIESRIYTHPDNVPVIYDIILQIVSTDKPSKGIYLVGDHGSGKTEFMNVLKGTILPLSHHYDNLSYIFAHSYDRLYDGIRTSGDIGLIQNLKNSIYIDDFLYQNRSTAKIYGNVDSVADLIITRAYELHKSGHNIYMTSNYGPKYMVESGYIHKGSADRLHEMMNIINWSGDSLRQKS